MVMTKIRLVNDGTRCRYCGLVYGNTYLAQKVSHPVLGDLCHLCLREVKRAEAEGRIVCRQRAPVCNRCTAERRQGKLCMRPCSFRGE